MKHGRPFQIRCVDAIFKAWETCNETVIDVATGLGKTVIFAEVAKRAQPRRVLILAHRRDLIFQAKNKVEKWAGLECEVEMGDLRAEVGMLKDSNVVVSSIQSQTKGRRMRPSFFSLVIIDEFHHAKLGNKSYMDVIDHYRQNPDTKFLGVTATLEPGCLGVFQNVCFRQDILSGIGDGYLVNVEQQFIEIEGLDYSHVRTTAGDLNGADLARVVENEKVVQEMVMATLETQFGVPQHSLADLPPDLWGKFLFMDGKPKRNLVFTASVAQAKMFSDVLNRVKPGMAAWVCGDKNLVSEDERESIRKRFYDGELLTVCNCAVWGEGYDNPGIQMVTMAAATKSKTRYVQWVGRGTRTLEGLIDGLETKEERLAAISASSKPSILILDFKGNSGRHNLITSADIMVEDASDEVKQRAKKKAEKSAKPENMAELLRLSEEELRAERLKAEMAEAARKARLVAKSSYLVTEVDPFKRYEVRYQPANSWERNQGISFSEKQASILRKIGVDPNEISVSCGRKLIGEYFNNPTPGQARVLQKHGYPLKCTSREASQIIDALAKNNWRRPVGAQSSPVSSGDPFVTIREAVA